MNYKYNENVEKEKTNYLVFNLKSSVCIIVINENAFELIFKDTEPTPQDMKYHDTSKIEFYRLMLFITDNVRVV